MRPGRPVLVSFWVLMCVAMNSGEALGGEGAVDLSAGDEAMPSPLNRAAPSVGKPSGALFGYQLFRNKDAGPVSGGLRVSCAGDAAKGQRQNYKGTDLSKCRTLCNDCFGKLFSADDFERAALLGELEDETAQLVAADFAALTWLPEEARAASC